MEAASRAAGAVDRAPTADRHPGAPAAEADSRARRWADIGPRLGTLAGLGVATGYLWAFDPGKDGVWPTCPSRLLLGLDCPGCGGLRGTHDLLHGDVLGALDHNLLLPATLAVIAVLLVLWMLPLVGRPARTIHVPQWVMVTAGVVIAVFTVARNLSIPALAFLGSG
jgi:hypothetical protein